MIMTTPQKITLSRAVAALPYAERTVYNGHSKGKFPWVSRISPWGCRTRELWVDLPLLVDWASIRGIAINLQALGGGQK